MIFGATSLALLLYWFWWGLGLTLWAVPQRFVLLSFALILPLGLTAQTTAGWFTLHAGLNLAQTGYWLELVPALLLATAVASSRAGRLRQWFGSPLVWITVGLTAVAVGRAAYPVRNAGLSVEELTTYTIGSCDAPDYAFGVQYFAAYPRSGGQGFPDQTDTHQISPHITLWIFWTQVNHFAPTVVSAFFTHLTGLMPWQTLTCVGIALASSVLPLLFYATRRLLRLPTPWAVVAAGLLIASPLAVYGIYHVALGQLMGTLACLATLVLLWTLLPRLRRGGANELLPFAGAGVALQWLLIAGYWISWPFTAGLAAMSVLVYSARVRSWRPFLVALLFAGATLAVATVLFPQRVLFANRALVFFGNSFGWPIAPLDLLAVAGWPESGLLEERTPWETAGAWGVSAALVLGAVWRCRRGPALTGALVLPTLTVFAAATAYYVFKQAAPSENLGYKLYKLVAVLGPGLVLAVAPTFHWLPARGRRGALALAAFAGVVVFTLPERLRPFASDMRNSIRKVDAFLWKVPAVAASHSFKSINIRGEDLWARIWVSTMLIDRQQHFEVPTYVGRGTSPLSGEWTFGDASVPHDPATAIDLGEGFWMGPTPSGEPEAVDKKNR